MSTSKKSGCSLLLLVILAGCQPQPWDMMITFGASGNHGAGHRDEVMMHSYHDPNVPDEEVDRSKPPV